MGFPGGSDGKESACHAGDPGLIPQLGRSPGEGKGYALQYSGLENFMDCTVNEVAPEVPAFPGDEALFHCAKPSRVLRGPANSMTGALMAGRGKTPGVQAERDDSGRERRRPPAAHREATEQSSPASTVIGRFQPPEL